MADLPQDPEDQTGADEVKSPKTKIVTGTWRCQSGNHDKDGNFKVRYDSGEREYEKRVPVVELQSNKRDADS